MPNESIDDMPQPGPGEIDQMRSDWEAVGRHAQQKVDDARHREILESTDRMIEMLRQGREDRETEKPEPVFEIPPAAQAALDAKREEYDRRWEIEDSKSTPRTTAQVREELESEGLRREPLTGEEAEAAALQEDAERREHAAQKARGQHATDVHKKRAKRTKRLWRPKTSTQRDIVDNDPKVKETYREQDQYRY